MFNNIGNKLMAVAKVFCWIGIIASIILGIVLIGAGTSNNSYSYYGSSISSTNATVSGITIIIVGCIGSWIASLLIYGFGQLIEDNAAMRKIMETTEAQQQASLVAASPKATVSKPKNFWTCSKCGKVNPNTADTCSNCGSAK